MAATAMMLKSSPFLHPHRCSLKSPFISIARAHLSVPFRTTHGSPFAPLSVSGDLRSSSRTCSSRPMSSLQQIVEHVVLFAVKPDADPLKPDGMVSGLRSLVALDPVLYLTAGPIHRNRSSSFRFTHLLHSRHRTKDDLGAYAADPAHLKVVKESVLPICDDIMAVDWVADVAGDAISLRPGAALRLTLLKPKEGLGPDDKAELARVIAGIKESFPELVEQVSFGENFSPARAKGFEIGVIAVFPGVRELEALDAEGDKLELQKAQVRHLLESVIVMDYQVSKPSYVNM